MTIRVGPDQGRLRAGLADFLQRGSFGEPTVSTKDENITRFGRGGFLPDITRNGRQPGPGFYPGQFFQGRHEMMIGEDNSVHADFKCLTIRSRALTNCMAIFAGTTMDFQEHTIPLSDISDVVRSLRQGSFANMYTVSEEINAPAALPIKLSWPWHVNCKEANGQVSIFHLM